MIHRSGLGGLSDPLRGFGGRFRNAGLSDPLRGFGGRFRTGGTIPIPCGIFINNSHFHIPRMEPYRARIKPSSAEKAKMISAAWAEKPDASRAEVMRLPSMLVREAVMAE